MKMSDRNALLMDIQEDLKRIIQELMDRTAQYHDLTPDEIQGALKHVMLSYDKIPYESRELG